MDKHFILIGYGDVGRRIAQVLERAHVNFVVVDKNEMKLKDKGFKYVTGDATDEEILKRADLKNAATVIIVLNNDTDIIFTSLIARNLNPHCISSQGLMPQSPLIRYTGQGLIMWHPYPSWLLRCSPA